MRNLLIIIMKALINNKKRFPYQSDFTQTRKVLFNCREELSAILSTQTTANEKDLYLYYVIFI